MGSEFQSQPAKVFLTYATGSRPDDAEGFGPGLYYVAALAKFLYDNGIPCFCDVMQELVDEIVDHTPRRQVFNAQLSNRFSQCELLIVIMTEALFNCLHSLESIHA